MFFNFTTNHGVLIEKAVVAAFNQEKALVGAFSVIVQLHQLIVYSTCADHGNYCVARLGLISIQPIFTPLTLFAILN